MLGISLDVVGRHITHEVGVMGRRGAGIRTVAAVVGATVALLLNPTAEVIAWLAATMVWEWVVTPLAVSALSRRTCEMSVALKAQVALTFVGASLFAVFPLLIVESHGALGGMLSVAWIAGSVMHAVAILSLDRKLLLAGLIPIASISVALPLLQWGWSWQAGLLGVAFALMLVTAVLLHVDSNRLLDTAVRSSASLHSASEVARTRHQIIATIGHELRTPVHAIGGFIDMIASETESETDRIEDLKKLKIVSDGLKKLVDRSIDLMRLRAGQIELCPVSLDVDALLSDVAAQWRGAAEAGGNRLSIGGAKIGVAQIDGQRLRQALDCLVENACKFTRSGSILIGGAKYAHGFELFVTDSGIGISEEEQLLMFEPLQQGDMTSTRTHSGSGLGLALVDGLTSLMGGSVGVVSQLGKGSTFVIHIPTATPPR